MLRTGIVNAQLLAVLARLGHTQTLVVADAGLPVPPGVEVVDLAVVYGTPSFPVVLEAVLEAIVVEAACVAEEVVDANPESWRFLQGALDAPIERMAHEELKARTATARAIVRTGEATPYANVILRAGVPFG